MARIEKLSNDFNEPLSVNETPRSDADGNSMLEEMYNNCLAKKGADKDERNAKSFEQVMKELSRTPLFMNNLGDVADADADGENSELDALRTLQYEGTKSEIAQGFKERGNEMVKSRLWRDAKEFYTKAIMVLRDKSGDQWEKGEDLELETEKEKVLEEQCLTNRALCHLELENYRSTTIDCASVLRLNPNNIKAYYRSASALLSLDKTTEASDVCLRGLKLEPDNVALKRLNDKVQSRSDIEDLKARKRAIDKHNREKKEFVLDAALKARRIKVQGSSQGPDLEDAEIHLSPDPMDPKSMLVFPVVFLYPMHAQSDLVKHFPEKDTITEHLSYIFPLPWDAKQEYQVGLVDCYMDTTSGGMARIGKGLNLLQAITTAKTQIMDGLVRIYVVPTSTAGKWIEEMKKRRAGAPM